MTRMSTYFTRAGRAGDDDLLFRTPELGKLKEKSLAVFGLGCLGAPSALEFARAGIGQLTLVDHDFVDPGTIGRWPFGLSAAGLSKAEVLAEFIGQNYPSTLVKPELHRIGDVRPPAPGFQSQIETVDSLTEEASAIYDATAELGVHHFLSDLASQLNIPYISVYGTHGGWGGVVASIVPDRTGGCWMCLQHALNDGTIKLPPSDPHGEIQAAGCGDVTFTGAGFDMTLIALAGVRMAVSVLCNDEDNAYPGADWDVMTISLRDNHGGQIVPDYTGYTLERHLDCPLCHRDERG